MRLCWCLLVALLGLTAGGAGVLVTATHPSSTSPDTPGRLHQRATQSTPQPPPITQPQAVTAPPLPPSSAADPRKARILSGTQPIPNPEAVAEVEVGELPGGVVGERDTGERAAPHLATVNVPTTLGVATGTHESTQQPARPYYAFRGIPYAKPPVGDLRWQEPRELSGGWPGGRLDATQYQHSCPQYDHEAAAVVGSEDCLFLNVFTPTLPSQSSGKLPVLFFLHGGGFVRGAASSLGPRALLRRDVVLITANYRLGALGFLSTRDTTLPGNYGALDVVAALRWTQAHVAQFGGDPSRVTVGGFSSGAALTHLLLLSPLTQGLFSAGILMGGAGNCVWSVAQWPETEAYQLARDLDCSTLTSSYLRDCLTDKTAEQIVRAQTNRQRYLYWPFPFRPVVDGGLREEPLLPAPVAVLAARPPLRSSVPLLLGSTLLDGAHFTLATLVSGAGQSDRGEAAVRLREASRYMVESLWPNASQAALVAKFTASYYYSPASANLNVLTFQMSEALTDLLFTSCIWDAAAQYASTSGAPVYTYVMSELVRPSYSLGLLHQAEREGLHNTNLLQVSSHGDDLSLLLPQPQQGPPSAARTQLSALLTYSWATFIHTGTPQGHEALSRGLAMWEPLQPGQPVTYYSLALTPATSLAPHRSKEQNLWSHTLDLVLAASNQSYTFSVATWVLLALLLLLLLLPGVGAVVVWTRRRSHQSPTASILTVLPRNSSPSSSTETALPPTRPHW